MGSNLSVIIVTILLLMLPQVTSALSDDVMLGLYIGCAVGGSVLLVLFITCCCVLHRNKSKAKKKVPKHHMNGHTPAPSSQLSVPPGIWTTNPTMLANPPVAGLPPQHKDPAPPYTHQGNVINSQSTEPDIKRPKRLPRDGQMPSNDASKATETKDNQQQRHSNRNSRELKEKQEVKVSTDERNDKNNGGPHHAKQTENSQQRHSRHSQTSTLPPRIDEVDENGPSQKSQVWAKQAKSSSKDQNPYPADPRVFSSYTNLYNVHDPYHARANIHGGKPVPGPNFTQSDAFLHKKGRPLSRTHSDASNAKVPPAPMMHRPRAPLVGGSWNPYGQGVLMQGFRQPHPHTQSLDRKPKAVFAPRQVKEGNRFVWKAQTQDSQVQSNNKDMAPPRPAKKPSVPKKKTSSVEKESKKPPMIREEVKPKPETVVPSTHDNGAKPSKTSKSPEEHSRKDKPPAPETPRQAEQVAPSVDSDPENKQRKKSSSSTADADGKQITADAFKFLDFYDNLSTDGALD